MRLTRSMVFFIAFFALIANLGAEPVSVSFLNGTAEVLIKGFWKPLVIGDTFDSSQSLKLPKGAILELGLSGNRVLTLCTPGTFILDSMQTRQKPNTVVTTVLQKLQKFTNPAGSKDMIVGGVRGDAATPDALDWSGGALEAEELIDSASKAQADGNFMEAYGLFMEALDLYLEEADFAGSARSAWMASQCGLAYGSGARALAALRSADPADAALLRGSYALLLASLDIQYGELSEAKALLEKALANNWFDRSDDLNDAKLLLKTQ